MVGSAVVILEPLDYGLEINGNTVDIANKVWTSGRIWLGLGHYFIKFPRNQQAIVFSTYMKNSKGFSDDLSRYEDTIVARSMEGMWIEINIGINYKVTNDVSINSRLQQLENIYEKWGEDYENYLVAICKENIRDVASKYIAQEFYLRRKDIRSSIFDVLKTEFYIQDFNLTNIQILNLVYPEAYEAAIMQTEIVDQQVQIAEYDRDIAEIESQTQLEVAKIDKEISISRAEAEAEAITIDKEAEAESTEYVLVVELDALKDLRNTLNFKTSYYNTANITNNDKILSYIWLKLVEEAKVKKIVVYTDNLN